MDPPRIHYVEQKQAQGISEYVVYVSSATRDTAKYPNPFSFSIDFDVAGSTQNVALRATDVQFIYLKQIGLPFQLLPESACAYPYFLLRVRELDAPHQLFLDPSRNSKTDLVLYSYGSQGWYLLLDQKGIVTFKEKQQRSFTRLTFQFLDPFGQPLDGRPPAEVAALPQFNVCFELHLGLSDQNR